jgi:hypothetical protein
MGVSLFSVHRSTVTIEGVLRRQAGASRRPAVGDASVLRAATTAHDARQAAHHPAVCPPRACAHAGRPRSTAKEGGSKLASAIDA